jgi:hypothetical protein
MRLLMTILCLLHLNGIEIGYILVQRVRMEYNIVVNFNVHAVHSVAVGLESLLRLVLDNGVQLEVTTASRDGVCAIVVLTSG